MPIDVSKPFYHRGMDKWPNKLVVPEGFVAVVHVGDGELKHCEAGTHEFPHECKIQDFREVAKEEPKCQTRKPKQNGRSQTKTTRTSATKSAPLPAKSSPE